MPELPEVEVLAQHLHQTLPNHRILSVTIHHPRTIRPQKPGPLCRELIGCRIVAVERRAKYLLFRLTSATPPHTRTLIGHLGMTGRMCLLPQSAPTPKHCVAELRFSRDRLAFIDPRRFGRLSTDTSALAHLGPEPLHPTFTPARLARTLQSSQPIKTRLLNQEAIAGIGNIYASEALFRARIHPDLTSRCLAPVAVRRLHRAIRKVLSEAIRFGSTLPLNWSGTAADNSLFYYGQAHEAAGHYEERLLVYDRAGEPCTKCATAVTRIVQAGRSTFFCPACQPARHGCDKKRVR